MPSCFTTTIVSAYCEPPARNVRTNIGTRYSDATDNAYSAFGTRLRTTMLPHSSLSAGTTAACVLSADGRLLRHHAVRDTAAAVATTQL